MNLHFTLFQLWPLPCPLCAVLPTCLHMWLFIVFTSFMSLEQRGVSLGMDPRAGIALPHTAPLCYRISSTEGHGASSIPLLMHARCPISAVFWSLQSLHARPPFLQAVAETAPRRRHQRFQEQISDLWFFSNEVSAQGFIFRWEVNLTAQTSVPSTHV